MTDLIRIPAGYTAVLLSVLSALALFGTANAAQDTASDLATSQDCAATLLHDLEDASLTREEKIALLEKALLESLNNFDLCQSAASGATAGGTTASGTTAGGTTAGAASGGVQGDEGAEGSAAIEASADAQTVVESVPVGEVQGDQPARQESQTGQNTRAEATVDANKTGPVDATLPNGKLPEDIPPVANDDIIARQFRQAAMEETDPVAKAKLWNEYRRYKNLPVQDVPETGHKTPDQVKTK